MRAVERLALAAGEPPGRHERTFAELAESVLERTSDPDVSSSMMQLATRFQALQATVKVRVVVYQQRH